MKFNTRENYLEGATAKFNTREIQKFRGFFEPRNLVPAKFSTFKVPTVIKCFSVFGMPAYIHLDRGSCEGYYKTKSLPT